MELQYNNDLGQRVTKINRVQDLENQRDAITQLYWEEDRDLPEVMKIMEEQYQFKVTARQYKSAFKRWSLQKHVSGVDMRNMVRIRKRRHNTDGKQTQFFLNKRRVPGEKIDRWIQRTGFEHRVEMFQGALLGNTPPSIEYKTPSNDSSAPLTPAQSIPAATDATQPGASPLGETEPFNFNIPQNINTVIDSGGPLDLFWDATQWPIHDVIETTPPLSSVMRKELVQNETGMEMTDSHHPSEALSRISLESFDSLQSVGGAEEEVDPSNAGSSLSDQDDFFVIINKDDFERQMSTPPLSVLTSTYDMETLGRHLRAAASRGDCSTVRTILRVNRVDVDHFSTAGRTALQNAAFAGHTGIIRDLLGAGANMLLSREVEEGDDAEDDVYTFGSTAVGIAIDANNLSSLDTLLSSPSPFGDFQQNMSRILEYAMERHQLECLDLIARKIHLFNDFSWRRSLRFAVRGHYFYALQLLLIGYKVDINEGDYNGTLLHVAISVYSPSLSSQLELQMIEFLICRVSLEKKDEQGRLAIHLAASHAYDDIIRLLLAHGIDPDIRAAGGETAFNYLHVAISGHRNASRLANCIRLLIDAGADPNAQDNKGRTLLHRAPLLAEYLVKEGADPDIQDSAGNPPLFFPVCYGQDQVVKMLLECGANPNHTRLGKPLLFAAVVNIYPGIVKMLIESGANPNTQGINGTTAIFWAVRGSTPRVLEVLLKGGADPNVTVEGETALHLARRLSCATTISQMLREHGAKGDIPNSAGETADEMELRYEQWDNELREAFL